MLWMPATGMAMGYFGGKGVPFFWQFTIPGKADKTKEDGAFAGKMFGWHTTAGSLLYYLIPIHVGGAMVHVLKGRAMYKDTMLKWRVPFTSTLHTCQPSWRLLILKTT